MRRFYYVLPVVLLMYSCSSSRYGKNSPVMPVHKDKDVGQYTAQYGAKAISEMQRTGVPASITLAQGIIESDYGRSRLAREANNHFGIKCHSSWKGRKIYHDDDRKHECFRKYRSAEESFEDHSDFLAGGSRYSFLFDLKPNDYRAWARGLKKAGYATNPKYASMLISTIEKNRLDYYDAIALGHAGRYSRSVDNINPALYNNSDSVIEHDPVNNNTVSVNSPGSRIKERNRIQYIIVRDGDTFKSLAEDYDLLSWEIFRYNDLPDGAQLKPGQLVYLQPKRNRAEAGNEIHIIREGETMYTVSQLYGIKLQVLYDRNHIERGRVPEPGTELWLRKAKPEGL